MGIPFKQLWQLFEPADAIATGAEAAQAVFDLAETIQDQGSNSPRIQALASKIPTLLEALNSPLGQIVNSTVPFLPIAVGIINFYREARKQEPTIAQIIAIVLQTACLESIKETLKQENISNLDDSIAVYSHFATFNRLELDDYQMRLALVYFSESKFYQEFYEALEDRLLSIGCEQSEANLLTEKIGINVPRYIDQVIPELGNSVNRLYKWYSSGGKDKFEKYASINNYLEEKIASLPEEKVFKEEFKFKDIYVPLKAKALTSEGNKINDTEEFILEDWVAQTILDDNKKDKVIFIQAGAGRGKSVFCRMFADWTRRELHPVLTPIIIRLRDIENYRNSFEETITNAIPARFVKSDSAWLADPDTRYLFLLDGFDELRIEGRATGGISRFIRQVGAFQKDNIGKENGHRIIITGRPLALQGITDLPSNLERVKILPMDEELQNQWFDNWQNVLGLDNRFAAEIEVVKLKNMLRSNNCPNDVNNLAKEPLLLYLIAKLHLEKEIQEEDFAATRNRIESKILIYEKSLNFVLTEQRGQWQPIITRLNTDNLKRILMEAGLSVVQSGGEYAKVKMIETRLDKDDSDTADLLRELRSKTGEKAVTTALGAFYLRPAAGNTGGGVEFYHKSFSEFLCAKRLQESIEEWTETKKRGKWIVEDKQFAEQVYDLFGYGGLTPEIVEYLMGLLQQSDDFKPIKLFHRLEDFYWRWSDGEFIDAKDVILPHLKMRELQEQIPQRDNYWGLRQIDTFAGLNIMILLLELNRYGQKQEEKIKDKLTFYPCGVPNTGGEPEDPKLLLRLMNSSDCLGNEGFRNTVGRFLGGANLFGAYLFGTDLSSADLKNAYLEGADLKNAYLESTNLKNAYLEGTRFGDNEGISASQKGEFIQRGAIFSD
ncbi:MAG: pentapeptide repeat-containing protein [Cyanobacteria bacterium P01_F01_bin.143]